jgi:hypothetical protein
MVLFIAMVAFTGYVFQPNSAMPVYRNKVDAAEAPRQEQTRQQLKPYVPPL